MILHGILRAREAIQEPLFLPNAPFRGSRTEGSHALTENRHRISLVLLPRLFQLIGVKRACVKSITPVAISSANQPTNKNTTYSPVQKDPNRTKIGWTPQTLRLISAVIARTNGIRPRIRTISVVLQCGHFKAKGVPALSPAIRPIRLSHRGQAVEILVGRLPSIMVALPY
jgi:hypothetical protein